MDYEKAYKEALERAKSFQEKYGGDYAGYIFPELRESEDERIRKFLVDYFASYKIGNVTTKLNGVRIDDILNYLEKQKEPHFTKRNALFDKCVENCDPKIMKRVSDEVDSQLQKEQKPKWSEVDEWMLNVAIKSCEQTIEDYPNDKVRFKDCIAWLKFLRPQPKQEWSEEDEDMLNSCISSIEEAKENRYAYKETDGDTSYDHEIAWLKSIRGRLKSSDNWKPSEEQMEKEEDGWYSWREATKRLNAMGLGISFFGNLFSYLRKRGKLDGLCKLGRRGAQQAWLYDVMGIAEKVKKGELKYKQRWIKN